MYLLFDLHTVLLHLHSTYYFVKLNKDGSPVIIEINSLKEENGLLYTTIFCIIIYMYIDSVLTSSFRTSPVVMVIVRMEQYLVWLK